MVPDRSGRCASPAAMMSPSSRWELAKMTSRINTRRARLGTAFVALAIGLGRSQRRRPRLHAAAELPRPSGAAQPAPARHDRPPLRADDATSSSPNDKVADVQVSSATSSNVFGKGRGETTVTRRARTARSSTAQRRVGQNLGSIEEMLRAAMPEATSASRRSDRSASSDRNRLFPEDAEQAQRLVQASIVGEGNAGRVSRHRSQRRSRST